MKYKLLFIASLLSIFFTLSASAAKVTKVVITAPEPAVGAKNSFKARVPESASSEVYAVYWSGEFDNGKFIQGNDYTITVKLRIKSGSPNIFSTTSSINATFNGRKARVTFSRDRELSVKYTWKQLGGPNPNNPKHKLQIKLEELAAAYSATNADNDKSLIKYLKSKLPGAEIWSTSVSYKYTRRMPSETVDGHILVPIGITYQDVTLDTYNFKVVLPAINKSTDAINLIADIALMKAALRNLPVTAKTTGDEVLAAINAAATHGAKAMWDNNYKYNAPTSNLQGSINGTIIVALGDKKDIFLAHKTLPIDGSAADAAIDADFSRLSKTLHSYTVSNRTTQEELTSLAYAAMKNGSKLTLESFHKSDATYDNEGKIVLYFAMENGGATRAPRISLKLPKVRAELPDGIPVSQDEWEVLRLTNVERFKAGCCALVMVAPLQAAADIRAKEIVSDYRNDHLRPDGTPFYTSIDPTHINPKMCGENANKGTELSPSGAILSWMKSSGHKANMLTPDYGYLGTGMHRDCSMKYYIQIFGSGGGVSSAESNTGSLVFNTIADMEEAYLICYIGEGIRGYVPLDTDYMMKDGNRYTIHLKYKSITVTVLQETK